VVRAALRRFEAEISSPRAQDVIEEMQRDLGNRDSSET
jgi:hypothetical protein